MPIHTYPCPSQFWRNRQALLRAREAALAAARKALASRPPAPAQVFAACHTAQWHRQDVRHHLLPLAEACGPAPEVLEVGGGMGWHATLLSALSGARVTLTDLWEPGGDPRNPGNVHTLNRIAAAEPELAGWLQFTRDAQGHLQSVGFGPEFSLTRASAHHLPFADASFDLIYAINCLEHIPDLEAAAAEFWRVLRPGGRAFFSSEPLYYSAFGHHLADILPLPYAHLLWEADELADLIIREAGEGRRWNDTESLAARHLLGILREGLNYAAPHHIRQAFRRAGPWRVEGWVDQFEGEDVIDAAELRRALTGIPAEALCLRGVIMSLQRPAAARRWQRPALPLHLPATWRRLWRRRA